MPLGPKFRLSKEELVQATGYVQPVFPKYVTQIINLANQNAGGTRPRVVGQMSELIKECPEKTRSGWEQWYNQRMPHAIDEATARIYDMVLKLQAATQQVDKSMVRAWVEDLIFAKTFVGLKVQEPILKELAERAGHTGEFRFATPEEEAAGIDGFVGEVPVSIKPETYRLKAALPEAIQARTVYYKKNDDGSIEVDASELPED